MAKDVPQLLVEKLALGELSEQEERAVRERLGDDADARIDAVMRSNAEILADHPPEQIAAAVRKRSDERGREHRSSRASWWLALPTLAAAAGMLVWITRPGPDAGEVEITGGAEAAESGETPEVIVLKGDPRLVIQRRRAGEPDQQVVDGDSVRAGDLLQLSYQSGGRAEGVIVSIDGRGVLTLHQPEKPKAATALSSGGTVALPEAYELDDAPGYERFFFVTGDAVDVDSVAKAAIRVSKSAHPQTEPLELPAGWRQLSLLLRKE